MFFSIQNRIIEITWKHVILGVLSIIILGFSIFSIKYVDFSTNPASNTIEKIPNVEKPMEVYQLGNVTTSSTVSTTTTTKKQKKTKYDDGPQDCTFNGKGHEAVLMPSGFYYCRSTERRVPIYVKGSEIICCVSA